MNIVLTELAEFTLGFAQVVKQASPEEIARAGETTGSSFPSIWIAVICIGGLAFGLTFLQKKRKKRR